MWKFSLFSLNAFIFIILPRKWWKVSSRVVKKWDIQPTVLAIKLHRIQLLRLSNKYFRIFPQFLTYLITGSRFLTVNKADNKSNWHIYVIKDKVFASNDIILSKYVCEWQYKNEIAKFQSY